MPTPGKFRRSSQVARLVSGDPRLRAVVLTYFACGPDSFANPFFKDEIGEPCYVMQIDEHTADAGVITRMEAFADTAVSKNGGAGRAEIRTDDMPLTALHGKKLWLPAACHGADVLAAAFCAFDVPAGVLPRSADPALNLGPPRDLRRRLSAHAGDHPGYPRTRPPRLTSIPTEKPSSRANPKARAASGCTT